MILLISNGEMAKHDVTFHEKHTSLNQDRLVQNRLLAADDRYDKEALIEFIGNSSKPKTAKSIREKSEELTGWLHSSKVALRKPEKDSVNSKGKDGPREFLSWRDSRLKLTPNPRENYVFKHYQDIRYYMKQYREENSTLDTASPQAPKRVSAFYHPGFYNVAPQPNREYSSCHLLSKIAQSSQNGTFQYTRRDSQKFDKPSLVPNLYKLVSTTARADSASSSENEAKGNTVPRNTSASGTRSKPPATAGKTPTKVSVPTPHNAISSVQSKLSGSNVPGSNGFHVKSEVLPTGSRTLDTLACVAAQEGQPDVEEAEKATAASEASEAISIGKLSTTCLGADAVVKQSPKLEASCTYHIFPSESVLTQQATIVSSSSTMMWNPQKSAFERKPAKGNEKDAGMNSPFKQPRSNVKLSVRRGDTNGNRSKRKYGKDEFPPLATGKMAKGSAVREHTLALMEIKGETSDAEKEPVLKVQSLSSQGRSHSTVSYGELHGSKKSRKMRTPTKKYCRSPIDEGEARHGSAGLVDQLHPGFELCVTEGPLEDVMTPEGFVPYHQYWNHNVPQRAIALTRTKKWCVDSDHNLKHLAEMVLADPPPLMAEFENGSGQQVQGPSIASGVTLTPRTLDGLSWREKLEVLRQINKPRERIKRRPLRLTFYKAHAECEMIGCRDPLSHDQVSHRRRVRHLIEQAKLKCPVRPVENFVSSKSKYWVTDPETGLDVHLNITRPRFSFSKQQAGCQPNTPRDGVLNDEDTDFNKIEYRLVRSPEQAAIALPLMKWEASLHQYSSPGLIPRSQTCIYPE